MSDVIKISTDKLYGYSARLEKAGDELASAASKLRSLHMSEAGGSKQRVSGGGCTLRSTHVSVHPSVVRDAVYQYSSLLDRFASEIQRISRETSNAGDLFDRTERNLITLISQCSEGKNSRQGLTAQKARQKQNAHDPNSLRVDWKLLPSYSFCPDPPDVDADRTLSSYRGSAVASALQNVTDTLIKAAGGAGLGCVVDTVSAAWDAVTRCDEPKQWSDFAKTLDTVAVERAPENVSVALDAVREAIGAQIAERTAGANAGVPNAQIQAEADVVEQTLRDGAFDNLEDDNSFAKAVSGLAQSVRKVNPNANFTLEQIGSGAEAVKEAIKDIDANSVLSAVRGIAQKTGNPYLATGEISAQFGRDADTGTVTGGAAPISNWSTESGTESSNNLLDGGMKSSAHFSSTYDNGTGYSNDLHVNGSAEASIDPLQGEMHLNAGVNADYRGLYKDNVYDIKLGGGYVLRINNDNTIGDAHGQLGAGVNVENGELNANIGGQIGGNVVKGGVKGTLLYNGKELGSLGGEVRALGAEATAKGAYENGTLSGKVGVTGGLLGLGAEASINPINVIEAGIDTGGKMINAAGETAKVSMRS